MLRYSVAQQICRVPNWRLGLTWTNIDSVLSGGVVVARQIISLYFISEIKDSKDIQYPICIHCVEYPTIYKGQLFFFQSINTSIPGLNPFFRQQLGRFPIVCDHHPLLLEDTLNPRERIPFLVENDGFCTFLKNRTDSHHELQRFRAWNLCHAVRCAPLATSISCRKWVEVGKTSWGSSV